MAIAIHVHDDGGDDDDDEEGAEQLRTNGPRQAIKMTL